ncbi:MAG: TIGR04255 family protein [Microbacterium sp.]|uniref:TIGR04255 family protein n=1 Tax=Microbacterium sp. TaxID=51671 RepID=UPI003F800FC8
MSIEPTANATSDLVGGLPPADRSLLVKAPLELAVVEVRFVAATEDVPASFASAAQSVLNKATGLDFTSIEAATQGAVQVNFGASGPTWQGSQTRGWQIATKGGAQSVTLLPGSVIVQTSDYERWGTSLKTPLDALLDVLSKHLKPTLLQRVGLRYVDRFQQRDCASPSDWRDRIAPSLIGPALNPVFGHLVTGAQQHIDISLDRHHAAVLRHGPTTNEASRAVDYVIDLDVFNHVAGAFDANEIVASAERLNRTALSLFQACVTSDYLQELQGKEQS